LASRCDRFIPGETTPRAIEYEAGWAPKPVCTFWIRVKFLTYVHSKVGKQRIGGEICNHGSYGSEVTKTFVLALVILVTKANMTTSVTKVVIRDTLCQNIKYVLFIFNFDNTQTAPTDISNPATCNFTKINPVRTDSFHEDGQADRHDETNKRFYNFSEAPKDSCVEIA